MLATRSNSRLSLPVGGARRTSIQQSLPTLITLLHHPLRYPEPSKTPESRSRDCFGYQAAQNRTIKTKERVVPTLPKSGKGRTLSSSTEVC